MTISEIAAQMGVAPETLIREVIAKNVTGGILLTALFVVLMLGAIVATVKLMRNVEYCDIAPIAFAAAFISLLGVIMSCEKLVDWYVAPETTANQYIAEHYGGGQYDD